MSKKSTAFQYKFMRWMYRGKGIFNPLNTGWIDEHLACVREWIANVFFYRKGDTVIMIDAGYHYERLEEKMGWLGLKPAQISNVLLTHLDTDHTGAVEADGGGLFRNATVYLGEIENRYLTGVCSTGSAACPAFGFRTKRFCFGTDRFSQSATFKLSAFWCRDTPGGIWSTCWTGAIF